MTVAILAEESTKKEILEKETSDGIEIQWADSLSSLAIIDAAAHFDLQFEFNTERIQRLKAIQSNALFVGTNEYTCREIQLNCIRINDWPGFMQRPIIEVTSASPLSEEAITVLDSLGWKYSFTPDVPGFITSRIIASIINEAFFTLESGISTSEEIDIAMKLGTGYPLGPFEWAHKIGLHRVNALLKAMALRDAKYTPSDTIALQSSL